MTVNKEDLTKSRLFADISEEKLAEVAREIRKEVVQSNTVIFRQGDPGDKFYVITSGKVRVFRKGEEGVETDLSELGPGSSFGHLKHLRRVGRVAICSRRIGCYGGERSERDARQGTGPVL